MADRISKERRSWNMSRIRSKDTKPEVMLRSALHRIGFRFRKNDSRLPGNPDIVLPKYHTVIFVHGCYWHRHKGCKKATTPKTNTEFWTKKFAENVNRDKEVKKDLENRGWRVTVVWECEIETKKKLWDKVQELSTLIRK